MSDTTGSENLTEADAPGPRGAVRWLVRGAALSAAILTLLPALGCGCAAVVAAMSPLLAFASLRATPAIPATILLGLGVGGVAIIRRRWFCRWMCPTGLGADIASRLGCRLGRRCPRMPPAGQWIAWITLGGAVLGYPLLLWLDPLAMFSGLMGFLGPGAGWTRWTCAMGVPAVLLLSLILPGAWCGRICPLGGLQEVLALPWAAISAARSNAGKDDRAGVGVLAWKVGRRVVLGGMAGAVWAAATRMVRATVRRPLRPPGAAEEVCFTGLCIRCGNCTRVCPAGIIQPDPGHDGIAGLLTPILSFQHDYCREDCTRCMDACPSGALGRLSLEEKRVAPIGLARVDMNLCLLGEDHECAVCRNRCPYDAIAMIFSEAEYTTTPKIDPQKCPGCGACEAACPVGPVKAIVVVP